MKVIRFVAALTGGMILWFAGLAILGVPTDLPFWRWMLGMAFTATGLLVWDKWA